MSREAEIRQKLDALDRERAKLVKELQQAEREERFKAYLRELVEADIAKPAAEESDLAFKQAVLRWLQPDESKKTLTIKDWVIATVGAAPGQLTPADLRDRFKEEFVASSVASLRQYLTEPFGRVRKRNGRLELTKKGKEEFRDLKQAERG